LAQGEKLLQQACVTERHIRQSTMHRSISEESSLDLPLQISRDILRAISIERQLSWAVPKCSLQWNNLQVAYNTPDGPRTTLHDCSGSLEGGEMLAIMGPSGAGKSTLLDILTMRKTVGDISGTVIMNGSFRDETFLLASTYVPQEDNLIPTNTVLETMDFYAELSFPVRASRDERQCAVEERLQSVGLAGRERQRVGGRLPGGFGIRGLSGGERRRLSIASGVVHSPPLVCLDEPTSGLDAFSALCVMESLRTMARQGHAIACTIHQPRQAILDMFNNVAFLSAGRLVYLGPPSAVKAWLTEFGLWDATRAAKTSLFDMVLDCITVGFDKPLEQYGNCTLREAEEIEDLAVAHRRVAAAGSRWASLDGGLHMASAMHEGRRPGLLRQYWILQRQQFRAACRSPGTLAARVGLHLLIGLLIGAVFYDLDRSFLEHRTGFRSLLPAQFQQLSSMPQDRIGVVFLLVLAQTVTPNCAMSFFIDDRQYYSREAAAKLYGPLPYHLANAVTEALICSANALLASCLATWLAGLPLSGYWYHTVLHLVSHHVCASAMVQACARLAPNQDVAFVISAGYIILCMLFANVLVNVDTILPPLANLRWTCSLFYAVAGLVNLEFGDVEERGLRIGDVFTAQFSIHLTPELTLDSMGCLAVVWAFYLLFNMIGFVGLKYLSTPNI